MDWLKHTLEKCRAYRVSLQMRAHARKLIAIGMLEPGVLHYLEGLEGKIHSLRKELRALRMEELGERLADVDFELDLQERRRSDAARR